MKKRARFAGAAGAKLRSRRRRPVPRWLRDSSKPDVVARSRCLMLLSVLSGEKPVSDAIAEAKISRGTYYQLETRALDAMLAALNPKARKPRQAARERSERSLQTLRNRIEALEQDKRRMRRLLNLSRKTRLPQADRKAAAQARKRQRMRLRSMMNGATRSSASEPSPMQMKQPSSTSTRSGETAL